MTKDVFLQKLKEALENELSGYDVQDNINYYNNYITSEVSSGRDVTAVIDELGDPWAIAKTIIDSAENQNTNQDNHRESGKHQSAAKNQHGREAAARTGNSAWWRTLLIILGIIGIFAVIIAVIGGIFSLLMPVLVPIIVIVIVFKVIGKNRR